jgi:two-component system sensor histidine kinase DesK
VYGLRTGKAPRDAAVTGADRTPGPRRAQDVLAPRLARAITVFALLCFSVIAVTNVVGEHPKPQSLVFFLLCICAIFTIQLANTSRRARGWTLSHRLWMLLLQAVLTSLPPVLYGQIWGAMWGCLAGSLLLFLPGWIGWAMFGLLSLNALVFTEVLGGGAAYTFYIVESTMLTGIIIYGLTRLSDLVEEVDASRGELARAAVLQERLRFARDLHDLLGYSLSAITLKAELIHRLVGARPDLAREEITGLLEVSRQALADVRLVASGYRDMSLEQEARSAAATLRAADIGAQVDIGCGRLHPVVDTVLATALREGITNILRHSKVQTCVISAVSDAESVRLTLVNDGVVEQRLPSSPHSGSGLGNLQTRLCEIGGRVSAGVQEDGWFRLLVEAPLRPRTGDQPTSGDPSTLSGYDSTADFAA